LSALTGNLVVGNLVTGTSVSNSYTTTGNVNAGNLNATTLVLGSATGGSLTGANLVSATNIQGNIWIGLYTANVIESASNLYYTNTRVNSNVIAFLPSLAGSGIQIQANGQINSNVTLTLDTLSPFLTTSNVSEGSNLYYTNARVNSFIQGNLATKANVADLTTSNISELTNLYYTNARVYANITAALAGNVTVGNLIVNASTANSYTTTGNITVGNVIANTAVFGSGTGGSVTGANLISATNIQGNIWIGLYTANVTELTNLYYTNARVNSNVIAFLPSLAGQYINIPANGQINANLTTDSTIVIAANGQIRSNSSGGGGVTLVNNTTENSNTFYLLMSNTTVSGTLATVNLANTKLFFNPNTGTLNSTIFNSLSDETVKTNRQRIINALSKISALGGYTYLMIDSNEPSAGLLAQEVQQVLPEAVKFNPNTGLLSLNYNAVLGLVVEAINELEQRVSGLENGG
jgi:hypothetical protein